MQVSARNQLRVMISEIEEGAVNSVVKASIGTKKLSAVITKEAVKELGLCAGKYCYFIFKASCVVLVNKEKGNLSKISARNQLDVKITQTRAGEVNYEVDAKLTNGDTLCAIITKESFNTLNPGVGQSFIMLIKASEIMVAI